MRNVTAGLWFSVIVVAVPAAAFADDQPEILNSSAGAVSGANRLGGPTITSPPHAWTPTGQSAQQISITDIQKEHPRNRHIVGPPVPRNVTLPPPQAQPQGETSAPAVEQPAPQPPKAEPPAVQSTDTDQ
jgi:hypothetical protein